MSSQPCVRLWQVEAVEDRRLSRADQASFERHLESCTQCSKERAELRRLHEVAGRLPILRTLGLRRRWLHNELLRRANQVALGERRPRFAGYGLALGFSLILVLLVGAFALRSFSLAPAASAKGPAQPVFEITSASGGQWHAAQPGAALRLTLGRGTFDVWVKKLVPGQSFTLNLPDGELEVRGTRFLIELDEATRRVLVSEGRVALRLHKQKELALSAGDSWPELEPKVVAADPPARALLDPDRPAPNPPPSSGPRGSPEAAGKSTAAKEFAAAMAAFTRGDYATADRLFAAFEQHHPSSAHVEDTAFLRALAYLRRGDSEGARVRARDYLQRFPNGFRAKEAAELLESDQSRSR